MLPLHDDNPTHRLAILTYLVIALNIAIFAWQSTKPDPQEFRSQSEFNSSQTALVCHFGVVPDRLTSATSSTPVDACVEENTKESRWLTLITYQFIHGGWAHLLGNMLFLFIFGNNVEDRLGRLKFLPFYLACGVAAAIGQIVVEPHSQSLLIGASGAISGILGAYLVMFPKARVLALVTIVPVRLPAWIVLGAYFAFQFFYVSRASATAGGGGVAYWAHIVGFVAGIVLAFVFGRGSRRTPRTPTPTFG